MVLGMHRSGTSAATRIINLLGPSTCISEDLLVGSRTNAKGHWESRSLFRLDNTLLADMGRTWWYPPTLGALVDWESSLPASTFDEARATFDRVHPQRPWVWKDPRACLTLSFWRKALGVPVAGVAVYRNPLETADSLARRDHMAVEFGLALWVRYTRLLMEQAGGLPLLVSEYDNIVQDPERWARAARAFLVDLGVAVSPQVDTEAIREFVDPKLRHSSYQTPDHGMTEVAADAVALYDILRALEGVHLSFQTPGLGPEPPWVGEQLDAVGPEWHPSWKVPGSLPPTLGGRLRALASRARSFAR